METFVQSQFNHSSLILMFHFRCLNNRMNNPNKKALKIVYSYNKRTFQEPLDKDAYFLVHHKNMKPLTTKTVFI